MADLRPDQPRPGRRPARLDAGLVAGQALAAGGPLSSDEKQVNVMTDAWLKTIEATFERDFGLEGVRAEYAYGPIPHQAALTVYVPTEPTAAMRELAQAIEAEYAELDRSLLIRVVSAGTW